MHKPLIRYVDRAGNVLAEIPAPPGIIVFNTLTQVVEHPEDFTIRMAVADVRTMPARSATQCFGDVLQALFSHYSRKGCGIGPGCWPLYRLN